MVCGFSRHPSPIVLELTKLRKAIAPETPVLIVGGGPSGLILALQLARHGIRCTLVERNENTTKWVRIMLSQSIITFASVDILQAKNGHHKLPKHGVVQSPRHFARAERNR